MLALAPHSLARARAPTSANRVKRAPAAFSMTPRGAIAANREARDQSSALTRGAASRRLSRMTRAKISYSSARGSGA